MTDQEDKTGTRKILIEKVDAVLEWAEDHPGFDTEFIESLQERLMLGKPLTTNQEAALEKLITRWNIEV